MKAIFDTRLTTEYDDEVFHRYHFPNRYLETARECIGDWVVYRATRRGGGRIGYDAVARVQHIEEDVSLSNHSYAYVTDYLEFDDAVPLEREGRYFEQFLNSLERSRVGTHMWGRSIREISDEEFGAIVRDGFRGSLDPEMGFEPIDGRRIQSEPELVDWLSASRADQDRKISVVLTNRTFRDSRFRKMVVEAYRETCAVTGLRIINGGGKAEVEAAHIWPVAEGGKDIVQNGLALSATCHWLFDRHLISLNDDFGLLVAHNRVPEKFRRLFEPQIERIHLPSDERLWPSREFVRRHRDRFAGH